jgi:predicted Ser/Thr protein kinase
MGKSLFICDANIQALPTRVGEMSAPYLLPLEERRRLHDKVWERILAMTSAFPVCSLME